MRYAIIGPMADEQQTRAAGFIQRWKEHGDEKQDTQRFWIDLLSSLGVPNPIQQVEFERRTAGGGFIDALFPDARLLVEQKSRGVDLDKTEIRQGTPVTPVQQALRYANALPPSVRPSVICTCNFERFRLYDLEQHPLADHGPQAEFSLRELARNIKVLQRLFSEDNSRIHLEQQLSENAGLLVARLHDALAAQYANPDEPQAHHALSILTVRIIFCLYAEDAGLFPNGLFSKYVHESSPQRLRRDLVDLFRVLDTPSKQRDPYLEKPLSNFPYVNGGLFREEITIPAMTEQIQATLISAADEFDWRGISPVIFGSLMEETLSHDQRRAGGMHYTTVKNIHRLIDPLFLDNLKGELQDIETDKNLGEIARRNRFEKYQDKLASLQFLDPACGSGNFLTETFLQLRELENRAIAGRLHGQGYMEFGKKESGSLVKVKIDQMHGIEINDFAVCVARTALWIAEQQALDDTETIAGQTLPHLPLHDSGNIVCANSLRYDWNEILPGSECSYVMGNPPFVGHQTKSKEQREDMELIWGKGFKDVDYVAAWFLKSAWYLQSNHDAAFAFVATNSISQGQQPPELFEPLFREGWAISFAHRTFAWDAQSSDIARVHVVIVGMRHRSHRFTPILFEYDSPTGEPRREEIDNINGYLTAGADVFVSARSQSKGALSPMLELAYFGSMPLDGGHLILDTKADYEEAMNDPIAAKYVHPFRGSRELINKLERWCLWLVDAEPGEIRRSPFLRKRVEECKKYRENAKTSGDAYKNRDTPWLFRDDHQPRKRYVAIPKVFSERREYATCDLYSPEIIASDLLFTCMDPAGFNFSIIESSMFMAWQKGIGGRLESRCRFANTVVWNTLPLPELDEALKLQIIEAGQGVLAARANHAGQSLADLYDPDVMPLDLRKAHEELDKLVDKAFGSGKWLRDDDGERLRILFDRYAEMIRTK